MAEFNGKNGLDIKSDIEDCLSLFLEELDEYGINADNIAIRLEYDDGFNYVKLEDSDIRL